jgi:hypothetical protein
LAFPKGVQEEAQKEKTMPHLIFFLGAILGLLITTAILRFVAEAYWLFVVWTSKPFKRPVGRWFVNSFELFFAILYSCLISAQVIALSHQVTYPWLYYVVGFAFIYLAWVGLFAPVRMISYVIFCIAPSLLDNPVTSPFIRGLAVVENSWLVWPIGAFVLYRVGRLVVSIWRMRQAGFAALFLGPAAAEILAGSGFKARLRLSLTPTDLVMLERKSSR